VVLSATGAAAQTNHLPAPLQDALAEVTSTVGLDLPTSADDADDTDDAHDLAPSPTEDTTPVGPDATGPAMNGLCTAAQAGNGQPDAATDVAQENLAAAAAAAGVTVEQFCADATSGSNAVQGQGQQNGNQGQPGGPVEDPGAQGSNGERPDNANPHSGGPTSIPANGDKGPPDTTASSRSLPDQASSR
jgi:hypothetical protein